MTTFSPRSILVVDDEVDTCRNLADIFSDMGYEVDTANDGESALDLVRKRRYDVALLDLMMPGMDGATLYGEIKKLRAGTVALVVTAHPGHPRAEDALRAGVWKLLPKPVDLGRLMGTIEEAAGQPLILMVDDAPTSVPASGTCSDSVATGFVWLMTRPPRSGASTRITSPSSYWI